MEMSVWLMDAGRVHTVTPRILMSFLVTYDGEKDI